MTEEIVTEKSLDIFGNNLDEISIQFELFSNSMLELYSDCAVTTKEHETVDFIDIRNETRNDAECYMRGVIPIMEEFTTNVQSFFENYSELTFEQWTELYDEILLASIEAEKLGKVLGKMHISMLALLRNRERRVNQSLKKLKMSARQYNKEKRNTQAIFSLAWFVNTLTSFSLFSTQSRSAEITALEEKVKCAEAAIALVQYKISPALTRFIEGVKACTGFFSVLTKEIDIEKNNLEKGVRTTSRKLHYLKLKGKSPKLINSCRRFYGVIPNVKSNFLAIPKEGIDENYIEQWLKEQSEMIKKECHPKLTERLFSLLEAIPIPSCVVGGFSGVTNTLFGRNNALQTRDGQENSNCNSMDLVIK